MVLGPPDMVQHAHIDGFTRYTHIIRMSSPKDSHIDFVPHTADRVGQRHQPVNKVAQRICHLKHSTARHSTAQHDMAKQ
jgi:hypothetical protein